MDFAFIYPYAMKCAAENKKGLIIVIKNHIIHRVKSKCLWNRKFIVQYSYRHPIDSLKWNFIKYHSTLNICKYENRKS